MRPKPTMPTVRSRREAASGDSRPPSASALAQPFLGLVELAHRAEQQAERRVRHLLGQHVRRVGDDDAAPGRRGNIDGVVADAEIADDLEAGAVRPSWPRPSSRPCGCPCRCAHMSARSCAAAPAVGASCSRCTSKSRRSPPRSAASSDRYSEGQASTSALSGRSPSARLGSELPHRFAYRGVDCLRRVFVAHRRHGLRYATTLPSSAPATTA